MNTENAYRVLEVASGQQITEAHGQGACAFSPDGRWLAAPCPYDLGVPFRVWDARTGREVAALKGCLRDSYTYVVAFSPDGKQLLSVEPDQVLLWDVAALIGSAAAKRCPPAAADLGRLWDDLASTDIGVARKAVAALENAPELAVPFLRERLKPVPTPGPGSVRALIRDLDDSRLAVRDAASEELERYGDPIGDVLRRELTDHPTPEAGRRLEELVGRPGRPVRSPRRLQTLRAMEVLEHAGGAGAVKALKEMADGAEGAIETEEARAALKRIETRTGKP